MTKAHARANSLQLRTIGARSLTVLTKVTLVASVLLAAVAQPLVAQEAAPVVVTGVRAYTINPGDEIEVYVWGEERLQRIIRILPDGSFSFPLVGKVIASGKLPSQIETLITKGLEGQYRGQVPQVTVSVRNPSGLQFSVAGRVRNSGIFSPGRYVNLLEALSFAGGPAEFANLDNISIIRKTDTGLVTIRARLAAAFKGGVAARDVNSSAIPQIESGDTVIVP
jgi:polysaccharide biosynthesis/export protein